MKSATFIAQCVLITLFCFQTHGIPTAETPKSNDKNGKWIKNSMDVSKMQEKLELTDRPKERGRKSNVHFVWICNGQMHFKCFIFV